MPCKLCQSLPLHSRTNRRHEHLQQIGLTERIARPGKAKASWITRHVCALCDTEWRHVDDPYDPKAGWAAVEQLPALCA